MKKKESKPKRFDPSRPNKDVINMSINGEDSGVRRVKSVKYQILEHMKGDEEYIASKVGRAFHITRRRALEKLTELEDEGLVKSIYDLCSFDDGKGGTTVAKSRIFSKI